MPYTPQDYQSQYGSYNGEGSGSSGWDDYNNQRSRGGNPYEGQDAAAILLGGPVGWGEVASGKHGGGFLGGNNPFDGTSINSGMTKDVYNSMTSSEWASFRKWSPQQQNDFISQRTADLQKDQGAKAKFDAAEQQKKADSDAYDKVYNDRISKQNDIMGKVQKFADEMNMPVDQLLQQDDFAKGLNAMTYQNAQGRSQAGMGGISQANADLQSKRALLGYQGQRMAAGQQAYDSAFGMMQQQINSTEGIRQFNSGLDQYNQNMDLQMQALRAQSQAQQYQQNLQKSGQTLGMIGGVIGGMYGGAAGANAGYNIGSGLGQSNYSNSNPYKPYQYTYPSSRGGGGGFSGGGLGSM